MREDRREKGRTYTGRHRLAIVVATPLDLEDFQLRTIDRNQMTYGWREFVFDNDTQMLERAIASADICEDAFDLGL